MDSKRSNLIDEIVKTQQGIFHNLRDSSAPVWQHLDLTVAQIKSLFILGAQGSMTVGQMAAALGVGRPAASVLIDRLVHSGLVSRQEDPVDRRRAIIILTPRGESLLNQLREGGPEALRGALQHMSDDDLGALLKGLRALSAAVQMEGDSAAEA